VKALSLRVAALLLAAEKPAARLLVAYLQGAALQHEL
jgi:hypothetical protein